jgi:hypothetical protein
MSLRDVRSRESAIAANSGRFAFFAQNRERLTLSSGGEEDKRQRERTSPPKHTQAYPQPLEPGDGKLGAAADCARPHHMEVGLAVRVKGPGE